MLKLSRTWLITTLALGACATEEQPDINSKDLSLTAFDSCEALEQHIEDTAVELMRQSLRGEGGALRGGVDLALPAAAEATQNANSSGPSAYTKTNTQVAGVDEADFVKTDGRYIYTLAANRLHIVKSWPAAELARVGSLTLDGYPSEMFLDEERKQLVVLSSVYAPYAQAPAGASVDCLAYGGCGEWAVATKATIIDVATPSMPRVLDEVWYPGWYSNARKVGRSIRLVLRDDFRWPEGVRWWPEGELDWSNEASVRRAREALIPDNEALIRDQPLSRWLPQGRRRLADGAVVDVSYDCHDFHRINASVDLGFTTVATLDLDALDRPSRTSVIADTSEVYADLDTLYLATRHWWWWPAPGQRDYSYVVRLDTSSPSRSTVVAAGGVEGHILNQFSMDEFEDHLRVATTIARRVPDPDNSDNEWGIIQTTNRVSVLGVQGNRLVVTGQTADLAEGERIQSARFAGAKGYVVTFEQIDPLFTLDLRDPTRPTVVGELKVPGFSTYIHPLGDSHLLTIGVHVPDPATGGNQWQERRMKLSIFDVSDLAHPREAFTETIGSAYGWSEAAWEHKAFNFFAEKGLLAIPFSDYRPGSQNYWGEFVSDVRVFRVGATTGIQPLGSVSLSDVYQTYAYQDWSWSWSPWVRRSVMADDFVYAISDAGVRVSRVDALSTPIATTTFDRVVRFGD